MQEKISDSALAILWIWLDELGHGMGNCHVIAVFFSSALVLTDHIMKGIEIILINDELGKVNQASPLALGHGSTRN